MVDGMQCATATVAHARASCLWKAARRVRSAQLAARHGTKSSAGKGAFGLNTLCLALGGSGNCKQKKKTIMRDAYGDRGFIYIFFSFFSFQRLPGLVWVGLEGRALAKGSLGDLGSSRNAKNFENYNAGCLGGPLFL